MDLEYGRTIVFFRWAGCDEVRAQERPNRRAAARPFGPNQGSMSLSHRALVYLQCL